MQHAEIAGLFNFRQRTATEWSAGCPECGNGPKDTDRFRYWPDEGRYWCRKCGFFGWTDENTQSWYLDTKAWEKAPQNEKNEARDRLREYRPDLLYQGRLNGEAKIIQDKWGLEPFTIAGHKLGYCARCPLFPESDSISIPYYWQDELIHLRHALLKPNGSGKYRPHMAGLSIAIFNADVLRGDFTEFVVIVEGEMKAMVLEQNGLPAVAIPGATCWKDHWGGLLKRFETVFVCLDPDVRAQAHQLALRIREYPGAVRVAHPVVKPDDWFVKYKLDLGSFCRMLEQGRLYK